MIELVIFDMDGVLVDSEDAMAHMTAKALLDGWNIVADVDEFRPFRGMGDRAYVGGVAEAHGVLYEERMKEEAYRLFCENAPSLVRVMPWSIALIDELSRRDMKMSVASAADRIKVEANLACLGKTPADFASVVSAADVERPKPAPDIFLCAARQCGVEPSQAIVCEDSLSGVRAAKSAGMTALAVTTSFAREELLAAGADFVCDDLSDLVAILDKPCRDIR